jgi:hypothetical protein
MKIRLWKTELRAAATQSGWCTSSLSVLQVMMQGREKIDGKVRLAVASFFPVLMVLWRPKRVRDIHRAGGFYGEALDAAPPEGKFFTRPF